jgi:acid phosphatase
VTAGLACVALLLVAAAAALGAQAGSRSQVPRLRHVVVIVFENEERSSVLGSGEAPTFDSLAANYAQATNDRAVAHPSLPNYLALVSGSTHGVTSDCEDCPQTGPTIGSQLTAAHLTWAAYAEGYPSSSRFAKKHVPFLYFPGNEGHVLPLTKFAASGLPAYSLVIPDMCDDMHDCPISTGDEWLARFVKPLLSVPSTAVFIVFDEGSTNIGGGGNVPLIVAGTAAKPGAVTNAPLSHYALLRTTEALLGLPPLGAAAKAPLISGIWR